MNKEAARLQTKHTKVHPHKVQAERLFEMTKDSKGGISLGGLVEEEEGCVVLREFFPLGE
jgi:hypothetical protein